MLNRKDWKMLVLLTAVILLACAPAMAEVIAPLEDQSAPDTEHQNLAANSDRARGMVRTSEQRGLADVDLQDGPTFISSDSLTLKAQEQFFSYKGNVEVIQADMNLKSDILDGRYGENNQIKELTARGNVIIVKGKEIRARSEKASYDAETQTLILSENPELEQNGSVLTADIIRIFLEEDRSVAEGEVRVKLINPEAEKKKEERQREQEEFPEEEAGLFQ